MIGFSVQPIGRRVSPEFAEKYRSLPVANVSDCMSRLTGGGPRLRPYHGEGVLSGPAFTVKTRPGDNLMVHKALDIASPGVSALVGQNMGAGNLQRATRVTWLGAGTSFSLLSVAGLGAYVSAPALVAFFVPRAPDVIAEGAQFIRIMCLAWGGIGVQLCVLSAFRASGNMLATMVIALVSQFMLQFPLAYILSKHTSLHAEGLWWSFPVTTILVALVSLGWFAQGGWKKTVLTEEDRQVVRVAEETITEEGIR